MGCCLPKPMYDIPRNDPIKVIYIQQEAARVAPVYIAPTPSAPPAYTVPLPPLPSAPPAYTVPLPPLPSAPPASYY